MCSLTTHVCLRFPVDVGAASDEGTVPNEGTVPGEGADSGADSGEHKQNGTGDDDGDDDGGDDDGGDEDSGDDDDGFTPPPLIPLQKTRINFLGQICCV